MKWKKRFFNISCSFNQKSLLEKQKMIRNSTHYVWQYFIFNVHIYYTCSTFKVFAVNLNAKEGKNEILLSCYLRPKKVWSPFSFRSLAYIFVAHFPSLYFGKYSLGLNCIALAVGWMIFEETHWSIEYQAWLLFLFFCYVLISTNLQWIRI